MKKLTTGIFTVLLGLVAVDANAAITSKAYVDGKFDEVSASVTEITENLGDTITNQISEELKNEDSEIAKALAEKADAADVETLDGRVTTAEGKIETLNGDENTEGSVANQIQTAVDGLGETYATKAEVKVVDDGYKAADEAILEKLGEVTEGKTVVEMIETAVSEGTYNDKEVKDGIAENKTAVEKAQADATKAIADAAKAQETADKAIPEPTAECQNPTNKCVLTYNNSVYAWEVIERGVGEMSGGAAAE